MKQAEMLLKKEEQVIFSLRALFEQYGYKKFKSGRELTRGLYDMYINDIVPCIKRGLNAAILTQVSDVEDETNGIATYDRQIIKTDENTMKNISQQLKDAFHSVTK